MSFILRQITQRVGAPDIVREKPLAAAEPLIGRGSDCDIQLSDLAVSLRHAVGERCGGHPRHVRHFALRGACDLRVHQAHQYHHEIDLGGRDRQLRRALRASRHLTRLQLFKDLAKQSNGGR